jgi:N-formylglutamate deformylase
MKHTVINPHPRIPFVANIPHSSSFIPEMFRDHFSISDEELREENRKLVDWFTDELYAPIVEQGGCALQHNVSRFVLDPERFEDDSQECMVARGMGAVYTHGCSRQRIRRELSSAEREVVLNELYRPYHAELHALVERAVSQFGYCILLDCHSYPEHSLPYEIDGASERPDFVLGTDSIHTPEWVSETIGTLVKQAGYSFGFNHPFAGTIVPLAMYGDARVISCMFEINRKTYMDETSTTRHAGFERMKSLIGSIVSSLQDAGARRAA